MCAQSAQCVQTFYYVSCHRSVRRQRLRKDHGGPENNRSPGRPLGRPPLNGLVLQGLHVTSCISVTPRIGQNLNIAIKKPGNQMVK